MDNGMTVLTRALAGAAMMAGGVFAAGTNEVRVSPDAKPIRDVSGSSCAPIMGYAGSLVGEGEYSKWFYVDDRENTAKVFREAGVRFVRQWGAVKQWQTGAGCGRAYRGNKPGFNYEEYRTDMKNVFSFYKEFGIKVMLTLENDSVYTDAEKGLETNDLGVVKQTICDYVRWIVDNGFQEVVAGFELGNEPYWMGRDMKKYPPEEYAARWVSIIDGIKAIWPEAHIGIALAEYFKGDPDVAAVRARMLAEKQIKQNDYFDESTANQWSGRYVVAMSNALPHISHVIYHSYGGCIPESCSYCGISRYRLFTKAFPELANKKFWITEWRERSDEDNRSHQRFRETLFKASYMMMMTAQPDVDGLNLHQLSSLAGALYLSGPAPASAPRWHNHNEPQWTVQWDSANRTRPDWKYTSHPRLEVGLAGPLFRLFTEALRLHPIVLDYGSEQGGFQSAGCSNTVWSGGSFYGSACGEFRNAVRAGKDKLPQIKSDCEYLITVDKGKTSLALLVVNTKNVASTLMLTAEGYHLCAPDYRIYTCPEEFIDCHEIPGEGKFTRQYGYEANPWPNPPAPYVVKIPPNSIATVCIPIKTKK